MVVVVNAGLIDLKMASPVEMPEDAPSEAHVFKKSAIDSGNALFLRVHQNHSLHANQDLFHTGWRIVAGVGTEL